MPNRSLYLAGGAGAPLAGELRRIGLLAAQRACTMFSVLVTALPIQNTNMQQYIISLALLIAAPVALPTSHANAQSQAEMNRQAAKDFEKADADLNSTYGHLRRSFQTLTASESLRKVSERGSHSEMPRRHLQQTSFAAARQLRCYAGPV